MAFFDLSPEELYNYRPALKEPHDFDEFWQNTLQEARSYPLDASFEAVDSGMVQVETYDLSFRGFGGHPIKGWFLLPTNRSGKLPCIVQYIGYGGGRGFAYDWLPWACAGYATLIMDTRGQGSVWRKGDTGDPEPGDTNPQAPGFMTRGILKRETYYYRRLITDAVRAVEAARSHTAVDPERIIVAGGSQGGGLSIAAAGLDGQIYAALPNVPFLCHYRRAATITDANPYKEIAQFCHTHRDVEEQIFGVLDYFDGVHFAKRAGMPALFSTALMDLICPPSTVFAAYNNWQGSKEIKIYNFNGHEGGESFQLREQLSFVRKLLG